MPWKLTIRAGSRVEHAAFADIGEALDALEAHGRELAQRGRTKEVDLRYKRIDPVQQVVGRIELAGPERFLASVRAGVDVRGDGSTEAYTGRIKRAVIEQRKGETAYKALRRGLADARHQT